MAWRSVRGARPRKTGAFQPRATRDQIGPATAVCGFCELKYIMAVLLASSSGRGRTLLNIKLRFRPLIPAPRLQFARRYATNIGEVSAAAAHFFISDVFHSVRTASDQRSVKSVCVFDSSIRSPSHQAAAVSTDSRKPRGLRNVRMNWSVFIRIDGSNIFLV